jgi:hypothetical protein
MWIDHIGHSTLHSLIHDIHIFIMFFMFLVQVKTLFLLIALLKITMPF